MKIDAPVKEKKNPKPAQPLKLTPKIKVRPRRGMEEGSLQGYAAFAAQSIRQKKMQYALDMTRYLSCFPIMCANSTRIALLYTFHLPDEQNPTASQSDLDELNINSALIYLKGLRHKRPRRYVPTVFLTSVWAQLTMVMVVKPPPIQTKFSVPRPFWQDLLNNNGTQSPPPPPFMSGCSLLQPSSECSPPTAQGQYINYNGPRAAPSCPFALCFSELSASSPPLPFRRVLKKAARAPQDSACESCGVTCDRDLASQGCGQQHRDVPESNRWL